MRKTWWDFCWVALVTTSLIWGCASAGPITPATSPREKGSGVKYDPHFGNALEKARAQHAGKRYLECVIRVSHPPTAEDLAQLKSSGFHPRSIIDTIVTGRIQVRHAQQLIDLPLVVSIEGGGFGGKKKTRGLK